MRAHRDVLGHTLSVTLVLLRGGFPRSGGAPCVALAPGAVRFGTLLRKQLEALVTNRAGSSTTLLLGGLAVAAALVLTAFFRVRKGDVDESAMRLLTNSVRGIAFASLLLMAVKAIVWPFYTSWLANHPEPAAQESLRVLYEQYGVWSGVQAAAVLLGLALLGYLLYRLSGGHAGRRLLPTIALVTFAIVFVGEFVGRMLFYVSMVRTGI